MSDEDPGRGGGEGEPKELSKPGGLGILFLAAALGLALILSLVGLLAYYAMAH
jgi:hypothetical protein